MKNTRRYLLPLILAVVLAFGLMSGTSSVISYADEYSPAAEAPSISDMPGNGEENSGNGGDVDGEEDSGNGGNVDGDDVGDVEEDNGNSGRVDGFDDSKEQNENKVILISTGQELYDLANAINSGGFARAYKKPISNAKIALANDIDLGGFQSNGGFVPIGNGEHAFKGEFDGGGFTISNLTINREEDNYQGLFGIIGEGGNVHDINLIGARINGGALTGGIAGVAEFAAISNCTVDGDISSSDTLAGGIAGFALESVIEGCRTSGNITAKLENAGGIVGYAALDNCVIKQCRSSATITVMWGAGGIAGGVTNADIVDCSFSGGLICQSDAVGSIAGEVMAVDVNEPVTSVYGMDAENDTNDMALGYEPQPLSEAAGGVPYEAEPEQEPTAGKARNNGTEAGTDE